MAASAETAQVDAHTQRLLDLTITPHTRASIEEQLCSTAVSLSASQLKQLLSFDAPQQSQISGARIASCRGDLTLAPLMFETFLGAKFGYLPFDPDIFERLLFRLQTFPEEPLATALKQAGYEQILDAAWAHLLDSRLEALMTEGQLQRPEFTPAQRLAAQQFLSHWLEDLLDGPGLVALQADSGDRALFLLEQLEASLLTELIGSAEPGVVRAAAEAARHLAHPFPGPAEALRDRIARVELGEEFRVLLDLLPDPDSAEVAPPAARRTYPRQEISLKASDRKWPVRTNQMETKAGYWPTTILLSGTLIVLWILAMAGWPRRRPFLKRMGAVLLTPLLLIGAEAALTLAQVPPLMDLRPSFNPNKVPGQLWQVQDLEGAEFAVAMEGRARQQAFPVIKKGGHWRVFVLGESSAHGSYYPLEDTFAGHLESTLADRNPGQSVEVINAGVGAALSDGIAHYAFESLSYQPDLLVLYLGNNDMSHFVAMAGFRGFSARSIKLRYLLDRMRIIRMLHDLLPDALLGQLATSHPDSGYLDLNQLSLKDRDVLLALAETNASQNIERVIHRAHAQGTHVLVAIQAQNQDQCPSDRPEDSSSGCFPDTLRRIAIDAARRGGAVLVDIPAALRHHAGGQLSGVAGDDYFYDTVHPSALGHAVIARALAPAAEDLLMGRTAP